MGTDCLKTRQGKTTQATFSHPLLQAWQAEIRTEHHSFTDYQNFLYRLLYGGYHNSFCSLLEYRCNKRCPRLRAPHVCHDSQRCSQGPQFTLQVYQQKHRLPKLLKPSVVPGTQLKPSRAKISSSYIKLYIVKGKQRGNHKPLTPLGDSSRNQVTDKTLNRRTQRHMGQKIKLSSPKESCLLGRQGNDGGD